MGAPGGLCVRSFGFVWTRLVLPKTGIRVAPCMRHHAIIIIIIIIIKDQTGHPRKSPRTVRLRRVRRGQSKIIRKTRRKEIYKLD